VNAQTPGRHVTTSAAARAMDTILPAAVIFLCKYSALHSPETFTIKAHLSNANRISFPRHICNDRRRAERAVSDTFVKDRLRKK
jgi:hypothetical protein